MPPKSLASLVDCDPFPFYESLRARGPVVWDDEMEAWLVTSHEACEFVQRREDLFAAPWPELGVEKIFGRRGLFLLRGEQHRRLYTEVNRFFRPQVMREYQQAFVRPLVADRIARFSKRGRADIAAEFADEIPVRVIGQMLGVPWQDEDFAQRCWKATEGFLRQTAASILPTPTPADYEAGVRSTQELNALLEPVVAAALAGDVGGTNYAVELWRAGRELFDDWSEEDVLDHCRFLFLAGMFTVSESICNGVYLLVSDPDLQERLAADVDALVPKFAEEVLRLSPPLHLRLRIATTTTDLAGMVVAPGDRVCTVTAAAGRDPARYEEPDRVAPERPRASGHLAFNKGPRFCSGAPLARVELTEAFAAVVTSLPDLALDPAGPEPTLRGFVQRGYKPLHVTFRTHAAA